jgi:hypothetical protein
MLDLGLIVEGISVPLARRFPLSEFKDEFKRIKRNSDLLEWEIERLPKIKQLGWFGKLGLGVHKGQDLYRIHICGTGVQILGEWGAISSDFVSPMGSASPFPCTVHADTYTRNLITEKTNICVTSTRIPQFDLPTVSEALFEEFIRICRGRLLAEPAILFKAEPNRGDSACLAWGDDESIIKASVFRRKSLVIMWEILLEENRV